MIESIENSDAKSAMKLTDKLIRVCEDKPLTIVLNSIVFLVVHILLEEVSLPQQRQSITDLIISKLTNLPNLVQQFERNETIL